MRAEAKALAEPMTKAVQSWRPRTPPARRPRAAQGAAHASRSGTRRCDVVREQPVAQQIAKSPQTERVRGCARNPAYSRAIRKWGRWDSNPEPTDYEAAPVSRKPRENAGFTGRRSARRSAPVKRIVSRGRLSVPCAVWHAANNLGEMGTLAECGSGRNTVCRRTMIPEQPDTIQRASGNLKCKRPN